MSKNLSDLAKSFEPSQIEAQWGPEWEQRGYGLADITPTRWTTTLRVVDNPMDAASTASTQARFVVEDRKPGPVAA